MLLKRRQHWAVSLVSVLCLACAFWHANALNVHSPKSPAFDVIHSYQPASQFILSKGLSAYVHDESAMRIPLMAAIWHALWGADPDNLRTVHIILSTLSVLMATALAYGLSGSIAAVAAASAWAFSPLILNHAGQALMESPYWFFTWTWLLCVHRFGVKPQKIMLVLAFLCGSLSWSMRPLLMLPALMIAGALLAFSFWKKQKIARHLSLAFSAPLLFVLLLMGVNQVVHRSFSLSTGAGNALYQGLHPMLSGVDAPVYHYQFDVNALVEGDHLSVPADRALRQVAKKFAQDKSLREWSEFTWHKLKLSLFLGPEERHSDGKARTWRAALLVLVLLGLWNIRALKAPVFACAIAGLFVLALLQTLPILHNTRYSAGALEIMLTLLAATGLASLLTGFRLRLNHSKVESTFTLSHARQYPLLRLALFAAVVLVMQWAHHLARQDHQQESMSLAKSLASPNPWQKQLSWQSTPAVRVLSEAKQVGSDIEGLSRPFAANFSTDLPVDVGEQSIGNNAYWQFELMSNNDACRHFEVAFMPQSAPQGAVGTEPIILPSSQKYHLIQISATRGLSPISPKEPGELRVVAKCPMGSQFSLRHLGYYLSTVPESGRAYLQNESNKKP